VDADAADAAELQEREDEVVVACIEVEAEPGDAPRLLQIVVRLVDPRSVPSGFTTLIILILFLGGVQLICLSIIGSYLAHIYDEVKRRPSFIVESILNKPKPRSDD